MCLVLHRHTSQRNAQFQMFQVQVHLLKKVAETENSFGYCGLRKEALLHLCKLNNMYTVCIIKVHRHNHGRNRCLIAKHTSSAPSTGYPCQLYRAVRKQY